MTFLFQIWFVRIALLFKLKSFSSAEAELNAFGDFENPDLFYEFYPLIYPGMKGKFILQNSSFFISRMLFYSLVANAISIICFNLVEVFFHCLLPRAFRNCPLPSWSVLIWSILSHHFWSCSIIPFPTLS